MSLEADHNKSLVTAMTVGGPCNDVQGDDTNRNGFRLIVDNDDEYNCETVRSFRCW